MGIKLFSCLPVRRNLFFQTLTHFSSNFSIVADSNVSISNATSQNIFAQVTTRFNISSADAQKMLKTFPSLGRLKTLDKVEQLVSVLNRFGCTEDQIAKIIRTSPWLLLTSAERVLEPKIQLLKDFGLWGENLTKIVNQLPWILTAKLEILRSNFELLKTVFPTQDLLIRATRSSKLLGKSLENNFQPSVAFWEDFGFRGRELTEFLLLDSYVLKRSSLTPEQRDLIRKIGIHKDSKMYKYIVSVVATNRVEVLEAGIDNLQLWGLSPEEAFHAVRVCPSLLCKSEENLKNKMDFMFNHIGLSVDFVAKHPRLLTMSLDKVMMPRFLVLQNMAAMIGTGEVNPTQLVTVLKMTEANFVAQIIQMHPESAALWTVYKNAIPKVSKA